MGPGSWVVVAAVDVPAAAVVAVAADLAPLLSCCPSRPCAHPHSREPAVIGSLGTGTVAVKQRLQGWSTSYFEFVKLRQRKK